MFKLRLIFWILILIFSFWTIISIIIMQNSAPGEMGSAVYTSIFKKRETEEKFKEHYFNVIVSDLIALNRSLPDVRNPECKKIKYFENQLPKSSVIITFHNEAWSTLIRTVWSVINRSPKKVLHEIVLVDDASNKVYLKDKLDQYLNKIPIKIQLIRSTQRLGLVKARLLGVESSTGEVIIFLDSHCECTKGWMQPLLQRIVLNRKTIVSPIIDLIDEYTFKYKKAWINLWGGFNWNLNFRWEIIPDSELLRTQNLNLRIPIRTPLIAGGIFAVKKDYFYEIGSYDDQLEIWGGDQFEISFRTWMCGGVLEIVPCSHVGHIYRNESSYLFPNNSSTIILKNSKRVAEVWMDKWKEFFYIMYPDAKNIDAGDLSQRKALRNQLHCKDFSWYLTNVYINSQIPAEYYYLGEIKNFFTSQCIDVKEDYYGVILIQNACHGKGGNQAFAFSKKFQIMTAHECLSVNFLNTVYLEKCDVGNRKQMWTYESTGKIKRYDTEQCLSADHLFSEFILRVESCEYKPQQYWILKKNFG